MTADEQRDRLDDFAAWLRQRGIDYEDRRAIAEYVGERFRVGPDEGLRERLAALVEDGVKPRLLEPR